MKLRRGRAQQSSDYGADAAPEAGGSAKEDPFNSLDPRYKVERKPGEEGNVTNSLSMLTAIPEVDLGMEYALTSSPLSLVC